MFNCPDFETLRCINYVFFFSFFLFLIKWILLICFIIIFCCYENEELCDLERVGSIFTSFYLFLLWKICITQGSQKKYVGDILWIHFTLTLFWFVDNNNNETRNVSIQTCTWHWKAYPCVHNEILYDRIWPTKPQIHKVYSKFSNYVFHLILSSMQLTPE